MSLQLTLINQFKRLWPTLILSLLPCVLLGILVSWLYPISGIPYPEFFEDIYETAGSRWSGLISNIGCLVWTIAASICFFSVYFLQGDDRQITQTWRLFFLSAGTLTTVLLLDDLFGLHELGDDVAMLVLQRDREISWRGKAILESFVFLGYGILFSAFCWYFRKLIYSTEYIFFVASTFLFVLSVCLDVTATWESAYLFEEYFKFAGILLYATYFFRTAKQMILASCHNPYSTTKDC